MQTKDLIYWALLVGVIYELAKGSSPAPGSAVGTIDFGPPQGNCCDPCASRPSKIRQQQDGRPAWMMDLASGNGSPFIIEGVS